MRRTVAKRLKKQVPESQRQFGTSRRYYQASKEDWNKLTKVEKYHLAVKRNRR